MIKFFKLFNGEEITADVSDGEDGWSEQIEMCKPYRNVMTDKGPMLIAYPCAVISVNTHHVIFSGEPNEDLANAYRKATGGIVMPPKGIQLLDPRGMPRTDK
jgi:hypothetical protein